MRSRVPKDTPTPTPILLAVSKPAEEVLCVVIDDPVGDLADCVVMDDIGAINVDDIAEVGEAMIDTAVVGCPAIVGTSDWIELSVAPGVEHPTPLPLPPTADCVKHVQPEKQQKPIPASQSCQETSAHF